MGNKLVGRRRHAVDEKYTRPQGLYQHKDVDYKKLRKLILESELAPCYPGLEENGFDLEECPICFLCYPSLNRSRCCTKGICTECFLQMKTPNPTRPAQCPFCKTSNYAVEYRGAKTKEEKGLEQLEEQRVIEAQIRMRQQELQEEERMMKRRDLSSANSSIAPTEAEFCSTAAPSLAFAMESKRLITSQESLSAAVIEQPPCTRQNRDDDFELDLEDIMVMEAIWLSIQENGRNQNPAHRDSAPSEHHTAENSCTAAVIAPVAGTSFPSGGFACAVAALAERQQISGESSSNYNEDMSAYNMLPGYSWFTNGDEQETKNYPPAGASNEISPGNQLMLTADHGEWVDHRSELAEVGTSYAGSEYVEKSVRRIAFPLLDDDVGSSFQPTTAPIVSESFEEQMMLAMAVSLAEARARTSTPGVAWH